jgi:hypothetical protein
MPDPRAQWFVLKENKDRWWLYGDDRPPGYSSIDALPLPPEPERERVSVSRRLASRLSRLIRFGEPGIRWTSKPPAPGVGDGTPHPTSR